MACQAVLGSMPQRYRADGAAAVVPGLPPMLAPAPMRPAGRRGCLTGAGTPRRPGAAMSTSHTVPPAGKTIELAAHAIEVTKTYSAGPTAVTALDQVSVAVGRRRFTAVMGPSGSGKSTLLHCLAGLDRVDHGEVQLAGVDLGGLDERRLTHLRRERVGFVFQSLNLLPTLTAAENITLPLAIAGRRPDRAWLDRVVDAVGLRDRPGELSGGQQQRVAAARALAGKPAVVFADEPTGNLDRSRARSCSGSCAA